MQPPGTKVGQVGTKRAQGILCNPLVPKNSCSIFWSHNLDNIEARRQTVLTDSEDENEEDALSTRSATLRGTVGQREKEVSDLKNHLETAKTQRELILDAKKRKSDPEEFQKSAKRLATLDYTPATYHFNAFSGSGILERGPPPSARQRAIDQEYDEREQSIEKFRERNAFQYKP